MKNILAVFTIMIVLLVSPARSYGTDIASGLSEFIYGALYANIGITSCKEITDKENGKEEALGKMSALVNTANSMIGEDKVDMEAIRDYFEALYSYCEDNPNELFAQALAKTAKPLFTGNNKDDYIGDRMNHHKKKKNQWSPPPSPSDQSTSSNEVSGTRNMPRIIS